MNLNFYFSSLDLKKSIIRSTVAIALGFFFCLAPTAALNITLYALGGSIILIGVLSFLSQHFHKNAAPITGMSLFNLALSIIVGLFPILFANLLIDIFIVILGVTVIISGILELLILVRSKEKGYPQGFVTYIVPALLIVAGLVVSFNPSFAKESILIILGIAAIVYGVNDIAWHIRFRRQLRKMGKKINDNEDIVDIDNISEIVDVEEYEEL